MKFSVITPCYLGAYKQAGSDRERKLVRAVNSVLNQSYGGPFEQIVVADGCQRTQEIIRAAFPYELDHGLLKLVAIDKQRPFSGVVRNKGIEAATGEYICYLDSDDVFGLDHLAIIDDNLNGYDWVFFNDLVWDRNGSFEERTCSIKHYDCGTSNIAHLRTMAARWRDKSGYGRDDWDFITSLRSESQNWAKIPTPAYIVCHIPLKAGYDL